METESLSLAEQLEEDGFVVVPGLVKGDELRALREAAARTMARARAGDWPYVRTVGKQFPPWDRWDRQTAAAARAAKGFSRGSSGGIWAVQHLMRPELGPDAAVFARSYFAAGGVLDVAKQLLGAGPASSCSDDDLVMELYNMLVRPDYRDFALRWHRDDIPPDADDATELARLQAPAWHAQWNLALWPDASLIVVPGSHRRARTKAERAAGPFDDPLLVAPGDTPQLVVRLQPGDAVFYNNNILHRGAYHHTVERATLHGSVGHVAGSAHRARNVLQHGVGDWVDRCDFSALSPEERKRAEGMRERLIRLGRDSGDVGYSQEG